ncbi:hypothetical protein ACI3KS_05325 [Microbacterium sp. ZW T5_45]|uniref:hypothetical protein n=1 Tax=Microbacterium sp. ZW T5_45 TaxID=3378080 RepID=UPI003852AA41
MKVDTAGALHFNHTNGYLGPVEVMDAEEYFQAREDARRGRWRDPHSPDFVVYPSADGRVRVIDERSGIHLTASREDAHGFEPQGYLRGLFKAAWAYFDAHPEVKPWHDAKEGEVWLLKFPNSAQPWFVNGDYFQSVKTLTNISKDDAGIQAARRIWPEDAS